MSDSKPRRARRTVYQRIRDAAKRGTGLRLTADDVWQLSRDDAILTVAMHDDWKTEHPDDPDLHTDR